MDFYLSRIRANDNFPLDIRVTRGSMPPENRRRSEKFVALHAYNIVRSLGCNIAGE